MMGIKTLIKKTVNSQLRRVRIRRDAQILGSLEWAEFFEGWFDDVSDFSVQTDGSVYLKKLGVTVSGQTARWLLGRNSNYTYCQELLEQGVVFSQEEAGLVAIWNGAHFLLEPDTLFILWELLVEEAYHCVLPRKPTLIFDIGMNVGFASLVLATRNPDARIVGFEPFGVTFVRAQRNLAMNPHLAERILPQPFGLSGHDTTEEWQLNIDNAATAGQFSPTNFGPQQTVSVQLKAASPCLLGFHGKYPDHYCVVKMDCEGGEYAILKDWIQTGFCKHIDLLVMEYHELNGHSVADLEELMHRANFLGTLTSTRRHGRKMPWGSVVAAPLAD